MIHSIYKITNVINGKMYIGFSSNPIQRWYDHKKCHKNTKKILYESMRKHGIDNFKFEIIYQSKDKNYTHNVMESFFIQLYNTLAPYGYNISKGGDGGSIRKGIPCSEETKSKISNSRKGFKVRKETKEKLSQKNKGTNNPMYGKTHSETTRNKIKEKIKNRIYDPKCRIYDKTSSNPTAKTYEVLKPDNSIITIKNLSHFCRENFLNYKELHKTLSGKAFSHKGFRVLSKSST